MRLAFFGTPEFAVPSLRALVAEGHQLVAAVTQPDRSRTRSRSTLTPSPVKQAAIELGLPILQPDRPDDSDFLNQFTSLEPELGVVVAYGHLLRPALLAIPRLGLVNVHASLLPRWRGAAPIHWAVLSGDHDTGISIMQIEKGLDTGGTWLQQRTAITTRDTTGTLLDRLADIGAEALRESLPKIAAGIAPVPQDGENATHAPTVDRNTAHIDWRIPANRVSALIRAMDPAPGGWTTLAAAPLKLFDPIVHDREPRLAPGTFRPGKDGLMVSCGEGAIEVMTAQPAGRRRMPAADWLRGLPGEAIGSFD